MDKQNRFPQGDKDVVIELLVSLIRPFGNYVLDRLGDMIAARHKIRRSFYRTDPRVVR